MFFVSVFCLFLFQYEIFSFSVADPGPEETELIWPIRINNRDPELLFFSQKIVIKSEKKAMNIYRKHGFVFKNYGNV